MGYLQGTRGLIRVQAEAKNSRTAMDSSSTCHHISDLSPHLKIYPVYQIWSVIG